MKSYTDIEQSKELAEILPLESADMFFRLGEDKYADSIKVPLTKKHWEQMMPDINPCWSLAALLDILIYPSLHKAFGGWRCDSYNKEGTSYILGKPSDNPIDACINRIKERNLI